MTTEEAEKIVNNWQSYHRKIFRLKRDFLHDEYVTYLIEFNGHNDVNFKLMIDNSTYKAPDLSKDEMVRALKNRNLIYFDDLGFNSDVHRLKTGGCLCGSWATSTPNEHSDWCKSHILPMGKP